MRLGLLVPIFLVLAGCSAPGEGPSISHVHGLAFDPLQQAVYVATHHGVAKGVPQGDSWSWDYVGSERYDYMGFTQDAVEFGTFYSSGHPSNPSAFGGVHLGLRRSQDGGETWEQRSLKGQVDFHALTRLHGGAGRLAGGWQGALKISQDAGATWQDHPVQGFGIYALASSDGALWAGTNAGIKRTTDYQTWMDASAGLSGAVTALAVAKDGMLVFASTGDGRSGGTFRSADGGATWQPLAPPELRDSAAPVLFAIDPQAKEHVFASTADAAIFESTDAGQNWQQIRQG